MYIVGILTVTKLKVGACPSLELVRRHPAGRDLEASVKVVGRGIALIPVTGSRNIPGDA
ncbi:MAG: hypothetical protein ACK5Y6_00055 [Pseudomonadota bacterium]